MAHTAERLIVGLGNPGSKYAGTRHNAGFLLLDRLIDALGAVPEPDLPNACVWSAPGSSPASGRVFFMKPWTYMNLSGDALVAFLARHPLPTDQVVIAFDDVSLPVGQIRIRSKGSAGGQRGMKHIIEVMRTEEIPRVRIGIDSPLRDGRPLPEFVLEPFADSETDQVRQGLERAAQALLHWQREGMTSAMAVFNANPPLGPELPVTLNGGAR